ncbi:MAG: SPOR domain-containing protein [Deltaproteobacteria bacterium]|nr:SPOR domain-containing protein [Candidatus Tharpella sp.]
MKKKRKVKKKEQGSWLENLLRFEIVVLLFGLIGFYYFLSFSPIRMPKEPIVSPRVDVAPLPPVIEPIVSAPVDGIVADEGRDVSSVSDVSAPEVSSLDSSDSAAKSKTVEPAAVPPTSVAPTLVSPVQSVESVQSDSLSEGNPAPVSGAISLVVPSPSPIVVPTPSPTVPMLVEAGSYVLRSDLKKSQAQLEDLGFVVKTRVVKRLTPMYRVFLGPYSDRKKLHLIMAAVRKLGDQPFLHEQGSGQVVVIGSFYLESSVIAWENMYRDAGFEPQVQKVDLMMPHTLLLLDGSQMKHNPQAVLARIQALGFSEAHLVKRESCLHDKSE